MKKDLMKIITFLIVFLILQTPYSSFAAKHEKAGVGGSATIDTSINLDDGSKILDEFNPGKQDTDVDNMTNPITNVIINVVKRVLAILRLFGGLVMIISLAIFGLFRVLSSNPELTRDVGLNVDAPKNTKALMDAGRVIIIGSILVFSSSTIVEFILNLFF